MRKIKSTHTHLHSALVLSGGGARAAYQVGVLKAIADIMPESTRNPFGIISGTSAGAINAVALASHADNFRNAVYNIETVWKAFRPQQVYRSDPVGVFSNAMRWLASLLFASRNRSSLLDNEPLAELLGRMIRFDNIQEAIDDGFLRAISVTASGYSSGHSVAFFQGSPDISAWKRFQRIGMRTHLNLEHLMASSAIPVVFPAVRINREYFGDGAVRQLAPLSPALHLGARKILVVGVSGNRSAPQVQRPVDDYPSLAQISGHLMNSIFLDSLEYDVERMERINDMLGVIPPNVRQKYQSSLHPIESLVISPSQCLDRIASKYLHVLPTSIRVFLHGIGATRSSGSSILSYLLFERRFCQELIALGYHDCMVQAKEIEAFMASD
ncbi:MAG: Patatin [Pseudomonadales bacterium]|jgi:NTE family protein|uniref:patatin-like phospholipase family protein n=1 Tax=unclassified Ketobacter TaxID=2639109 RepID=UPI000C4FAFC3|nr:MULTISPECIES: patatin-like phospholipase family protein [unclassified Ketobacter]MAA58968.1 Patatin [Pseudomonadales bacterium]MEC8811818.1 patatin-like phospholipase family protein [Pseudomonadota bacterium]TNC83603.1 MAG: Patatin [Alcanivorax sp.]HAG95791.1 Patatin [Gammaproteobacteria bacterium]MAA61196.1 Patatin [Pseudomonadales bacterium]|tara:strand:- start:21071 stop:22222 length:1152 start_codon:yes stop_codon:yes gene_type:complete